MENDDNVINNNYNESNNNNNNNEDESNGGNKVEMKDSVMVSNASEDQEINKIMSNASEDLEINRMVSNDSEDQEINKIMSNASEDQEINKIMSNASEDQEINRIMSNESQRVSEIKHEKYDERSNCKSQVERTRASEIEVSERRSEKEKDSGSARRSEKETCGVSERENSETESENAMTALLKRLPKLEPLQQQQPPYRTPDHPGWCIPESFSADDDDDDDDDNNKGGNNSWSSDYDDNSSRDNTGNRVSETANDVTGDKDVFGMQSHVTKLQSFVESLTKFTKNKNKCNNNNNNNNNNKGRDKNSKKNNNSMTSSQNRDVKKQRNSMKRYVNGCELQGRELYQYCFSLPHHEGGGVGGGGGGIGFERSHHATDEDQPLDLSTKKFRTRTTPFSEDDFSSDRFGRTEQPKTENERTNLFGETVLLERWKNGSWMETSSGEKNGGPFEAFRSTRLVLPSREGSGRDNTRPIFSNELPINYGDVRPYHPLTVISGGAGFGDDVGYNRPLSLIIPSGSGGDIQPHPLSSSSFASRDITARAPVGLSSPPPVQSENHLFVRYSHIREPAQQLDEMSINVNNDVIGRKSHETTSPSNVVNSDVSHRHVAGSSADVRTSGYPQLKKRRLPPEPRDVIRSAPSSGSNRRQRATADAHARKEEVENHVHLTNMRCSCDQVFETLFRLAVHMEESGHLPPGGGNLGPETAIGSLPKLVRGQDVWMSRGFEHAEMILRCVQCDASFRSLPELTVHMIRTKHYVNIVGTEGGYSSQAAATESMTSHDRQAQLPSDGCSRVAKQPKQPDHRLVVATTTTANDNRMSERDDDDDDYDDRCRRHHSHRDYSRDPSFSRKRFAVDAVSMPNVSTATVSTPTVSMLNLTTSSRGRLTNVNESRQMADRRREETNERKHKMAEPCSLSFANPTQHWSYLPVVANPTYDGSDWSAEKMLYGSRYNETTSFMTSPLMTSSADVKDFFPVGRQNGVDDSYDDVIKEEEEEEEEEEAGNESVRVKIENDVLSLPEKVYRDIDDGVLSSSFVDVDRERPPGVRGENFRVGTSTTGFSDVSDYLRKCEKKRKICDDSDAGRGEEAAAAEIQRWRRELRSRWQQKVSMETRRIKEDDFPLGGIDAERLYNPLRMTAGKVEKLEGGGYDELERGPGGVCRPTTANRLELVTPPDNAIDSTATLKAMMMFVENSFSNETQQPPGNIFPGVSSGGRDLQDLRSYYSQPQSHPLRAGSSASLVNVVKSSRVESTWKKHSGGNKVTSIDNDLRNSSHLKTSFSYRKESEVPENGIHLRTEDYYHQKEIPKEGIISKRDNYCRDDNEIPREGIIFRSEDSHRKDIPIEGIIFKSENSHRKDIPVDGIIFKSENSRRKDIPVDGIIFKSENSHEEDIPREGFTFRSDDSYDKDIPEKGIIFKTEDYDRLTMDEYKEELTSQRNDVSEQEEQSKRKHCFEDNINAFALINGNLTKYEEIKGIALNGNLVIKKEIASSLNGNLRTGDENEVAINGNLSEDSGFTMIPFNGNLLQDGETKGISLNRGNLLNDKEVKGISRNDVIGFALTLQT